MMRSDEEIERRLEEWLEDEAQPMPREAMESALEAVARTAQVRGRPWRPAWMQARGFTLAATAAAAAVVVLGGIFAVSRLDQLLEGIGSRQSASPLPSYRWDPVEDFRVSPNQLNPSPDSYGNQNVWSYLWSSSSTHDPAAYVTLPEFQVDAWHDSSADLSVGLVEADGTLYFQPWTDGALRKHAILGWTSPISGEVRISGFIVRVEDPCDGPGANVTFTVDRETETLHTIALGVGGSQTFDVAATVDSGETIYFVLEADLFGRCDLTSMGLEITNE